MRPVRDWHDPSFRTGRLRERPGPTPSQRRKHVWAAGRRGQARWWSVCIDLGPTAVSAFRATVQDLLVSEKRVVPWP